MGNNRRAIVLAFVIGLGQLTYAQAPTTSERDKAILAVKACLHRNEVASRECQKLNENIEQLIAVYKSGDKSVLPLLLKFTYLTDFYDYALLNDHNGFLTAMNELPAPERRAVAVGLAGGEFRPLSRDRFDEIRSVLRSKSDDADVATVARECLKELEDRNASLFLNYFPAGTFTSKAGVLQVRWYSGELHSLGELPLIPISNHEQVLYRFTYIPAFSTPKSLTLTVQPNGTGELKIASIQKRSRNTVVEKKPVTHDQVNQFFSKLDSAEFWRLPVEGKNRGFDGAEWIMEGVQNGGYHIAVRWCPGSYPKQEAPQDSRFGDAARTLLELAGFNSSSY